MTYVSKGEKIFMLPNRTLAACTSPQIRRSDGRLKSFSSILDDRAWSLDEDDRYRYLYDLTSGSQTCLAPTSCFKYVPLEDLIALLLADRDAYIKCLEKQLEGKKPCSQPEETPVYELYKAPGFGNDEQEDTLSMRKKIASLTAELEECKITRDTLRAAMHKLEDIDEIVSENKSLKSKLRCSEELIKCLEEKKSKLEKELENLRTKSQIQVDLADAQERLQQMREEEQMADGEELTQLARERDNLQNRVYELQNELQEAKSKQSELELLKKQSVETTLNLEEMVRENECYKKKLASMKCLERRIQELKKQATAFAEKYKRDVAKSSSRDKQMRDICFELENLREERDRLKKRVGELSLYEIQYNSLQCKLKQVDCIIAENETLNCKLASLDKLEMENQLLRCKLEQCQASELEAAESKEKIIELQNAVADQEEEMKDLLCQIERLTAAYGDNDELERLREELCKKDCRLKLCEEQLAEIPLLEAEIDELRSKFENCYNNMEGPGKKSHTKSKNEDEASSDSKCADDESEKESEACKERKPDAPEKRDSEKDSMTCEEVQNLLQSSKGIITCVLEDMVEHQKEMEELEKCNQEMKDEICLLKAKMGKTDMDDCLEQIAELNRVIQEKELRICCLETQLARGGDLGKVNDHISNLECEIEYLKDLNRKMREDLAEACREVQRCAELECMLEEERRGRLAAEDSARQAKDLDSRKSSKSLKEEFNLEAKESAANEIDYLRCQVEELNSLVEELKKENGLLKEMQQPCPDYMKELEEKNALEELLNLLQCELDACRLEKGDDCEDLKDEVDRLKHQNCQLKSLVNCYKERLDLECSKDDKAGGRSAACLIEENHRLRSEIIRLRCEMAELCKRIQEMERIMCEREDEVDELRKCCDGLSQRNEELEKEVDEKEGEAKSLKGEMSKLLDQAYKLASDNDVLKNRLKETESPQSGVSKDDYEQDLSEKHAIESTMRNVEEEVDGLKVKLEESAKAEQERNNLLKKQGDMEAEIEKLRKQLTECKETARVAEEKVAAVMAGGPGALQKQMGPSDAASPFSDQPGSAKALADAKAMDEKAKEEKAREEKAREEKAREEKAREDKAREEKAKEDKAREEKAKEDAAREEKSKEEKAREEKAKEERAREEKAKEEKAREEKAKEEKAREEKAKEDKAREEKAKEEKAKEEKAKEEAKAKEEKLLQEVAGMKEQSAKLQAEANEAKAENKKLKGEIDDLKKLLDQCNKDKTNEAAQAQLMSSKLQGTSYPVPAQGVPQGVPQTMIPITQEQRATVYDRGTAGAVTQPASPKVAFIEPSPEQLMKVVVDGDDTKKAGGKSDAGKQEGRPGTPKGGDDKSGKGPGATPSKPGDATSAAKAAAGAKGAGAQLTPSKAAMLTPSKAAMLTPSKAAMFTPSKLAQLSPSKAALFTPSKLAQLSPSKAALFTPSKLAQLSPSKAAMFSPSKLAQLTPSKAAMFTPSKLAQLTPSKAAMFTPSKLAQLTPSKAALFTPSKLAQLSPSKAALITGKLKDGKTPAEKESEGKSGLGSSASDESLLSFTEIDPDFCKFLCTLNPENHRQNICEIERRYSEKICELEKKNNEKIKLLIEQYEKESKMRDRTYNDNLNSVRSGYESDIRKLVDRHKASIMRLQSLHEDEVQELNVNYETQMEAMQTQNENIVNDLTSGATQKFKMLAEQHNKDIQELEKKYQQLLEKKEAEHIAELSSFAGGKQEGGIADLQSKHNRELNKLKKSNLKQIDMVKHKYEDLLMCERKKYEKQLEDTVQKLRKGHPVADSICQCRFEAPCGPKDPNAPIEFNDVLHKILTEGLESLSFNEVALVHRRTCAATEDIVLKPDVTAQLSPPIAVDPCAKNQLMKANKEELLNRILVLDNEIAIKRMETQAAIVNMEMAVKAERKRLQDLRDTLKHEQDKNLELNTKLSAAEGMKSAMEMKCSPMREHDIMQKIKQLQKEKCAYQPIVPEKDTGTVKKRDPSAESGKKKVRSGECRTRHKSPQKKKVKK